jgi:hypothetical protein
MDDDLVKRERKAEEEEVVVADGDNARMKADTKSLEAGLARLQKN